MKRLHHEYAGRHMALLAYYDKSGGQGHCWSRLCAMEDLSHYEEVLDIAIEALPDKRGCGQGEGGRYYRWHWVLLPNRKKP